MDRLCAEADQPAGFRLQELAAGGPEGLLIEPLGQRLLEQFLARVDFVFLLQISDRRLQLAADLGLHVLRPLRLLLHGGEGGCVQHHHLSGSLLADVQVMIITNFYVGLLHLWF